MWDLLIRNGYVFDGLGGTPRTLDIAIRGERVAALGIDLDPAHAETVIDASGKWVMPGLVDVHTHFDLEVEIAPGLPETVRHGTTTVVVANCSLGLAYGNQRRDGADPIVDCFARVENVPKPVLRKVADRATWSDSGDYLEHLDSLPLGPNIVTMIPHSMLRIEVMGMKGSIEREPTAAEMDEMTRLLEKAMREGYPGFSTDALPFHYLANDPNRQRKIPTQYAGYRELKRLTAVLRKHDRVWQATPPKDKPLEIFRQFLLTSGRLHGKPLKITAVAALDVATNRGIAKLGLFMARILNSAAVRGRFWLQALAAPFKVWAEGPLTPVFEEIPELRLLNEPDLEDREGRRRHLDDPNYIRRFRDMWLRGKQGYGLDRLKRLIKREDLAFSRDLADMVVERCPVAAWQGVSFARIQERVLAFQAGRLQVDDAEEAEALAAFPAPLEDEAELVLHLLRTYDTDLYWYSVTANRDPETVSKLVLHPKLLPGFNDSGAHLTNMAFYDGNLRALQIAQREGERAVAFTVERLTRVPAEFFDVDAGTLAPGSRADVTIVDPEALADYDAEANIESRFREDFGHEQLVNRSDGVVAGVVIGGRVAWDGTAYVSYFGKERLGRVLRAGGVAASGREESTRSSS